MEPYLSAVQTTLHELTGCHGVAQLIASNVRDCLTLDALARLRNATTTVEVVQELRAYGADARVATVGLERLVRLLTAANTTTVPLGGAGRFSVDFPTSREFLEEQGGLDAILQVMTQHPEIMLVQKHASLVLAKVLSHGVAPSINTCMLESPERTVQALLQALARHPDRVELQNEAVAALSVLERAQTKHLRLFSHDNNRVYPFQASVAALQGIPLLFAAIQRYPENYSISACALNVLQSLHLGHDNDNEASNSNNPNSPMQALVGYARAHPEWRTAVQRCSASGGTEAYVLMVLLSRGLQQQQH